MTDVYVRERVGVILRPAKSGVSENLKMLRPCLAARPDNTTVRERPTASADRREIINQKDLHVPTTWTV